MTVVSVPYDFVGGTRAIADQVDANFAALVNAFNANVSNVLATATTFYVSPSGADIAGNGLSATSPAATMTYILNLLRASYDLNMQNVTIQLANGTYTEGVNNIGEMPGLQSASGLTIQGNMANPGAVIWNGTANACLNCSNGALISVQGVTMQNSTANCIIAQSHSRILFNNVAFGAAFGAHLVSARGATLTATGNYTISGGAQRHANALEHGEIYLDSEPGNFLSFTTGAPAITLSGTPAFSINFATSNNGSSVKVGAVFTGTATGNQGSAGNNGVIIIYGQGTSYLPGTANTVTLTTGGQYN